MKNINIKQQKFTINDVPTRLHHLATNLSEIKSLFMSNSHQESILELIKESRYFIEWVVPDMVSIDVEQAGLKIIIAYSIKSRNTVSNYVAFIIESKCLSYCCYLTSQSHRISKSCNTSSYLGRFCNIYVFTIVKY
ncbi:hypothetical protein NIES4071_42810 [Calothrix sp. NIES-4071]|nr:hypothetical protein NIES4071_42810 [Calothrix sp. NIES-4071]BAZ58594.1 hypothetical protein NIES4105_42730 [Calothrix sp. NIES-4105]